MKKQAFSGRVFNPGLGGAAGSPGSPLWPAVAAGLFWLAAGLGAGYWVLRTWGTGPLTPVVALGQEAPVGDVDAVARALGARTVVAEGAPVETTTATQYQLVGVVAQGGSGGAALIAVDGHPPRPFRVGDAVFDGVVLQSVGPRSVQLGARRTGPSDVELKLPAREE